MQRGIYATASVALETDRTNVNNNEGRTITIGSLPTFNSHDVVADLLSQQWVRYQLHKVIQSVYGRMHALKTLDLLPDGQGRVETRLGMLPATHGASVPYHLARETQLAHHNTTPMHSHFNAA